MKKKTAEIYIDNKYRVPIQWDHGQFNYTDGKTFNMSCGKQVTFKSMQEISWHMNKRLQMKKVPANHAAGLPLCKCPLTHPASAPLWHHRCFFLQPFQKLAASPSGVQRFLEDGTNAPHKASPASVLHAESVILLGKNVHLLFFMYVEDEACVVCKPCGRRNLHERCLLVLCFLLR